MRVSNIRSLSRQRTPTRLHHHRRRRAVDILLEPCSKVSPSPRKAVATSPTRPRHLDYYSQRKIRVKNGFVDRLNYRRFQKLNKTVTKRERMQWRRSKKAMVE